MRGPEAGRETANEEAGPREDCTPPGVRSEPTPPPPPGSTPRTLRGSLTSTGDPPRQDHGSEDRGEQRRALTWSAGAPRAGRKAAPALGRAISGPSASGQEAKDQPRQPPTRRPENGENRRPPIAGEKGRPAPRPPAGRGQRVLCGRCPERTFKSSSQGK